MIKMSFVDILCIGDEEVLNVSASRSECVFYFNQKLLSLSFFGVWTNYSGKPMAEQIPAGGLEAMKHGEEREALKWSLAIFV